MMQEGELTLLHYRLWPIYRTNTTYE